MRTAPYRIEVADLVIRCYSPTDADALKECVDASLPELQARMPWALADPQTRREKIELLRGMRSRFDADTDYVMGIFDGDESRLLGGTGFKLADVEEGAVEIGYFVRTDAARRGSPADRPGC
ncbi:MAG: GNAT family N-acetyltransferase [Candidatus Nanopelagicales bacterium]